MYAALGIMIGTLILYTEITQNTIPKIAESTGETVTTLAILTGVGIVLAVVGLIVNPLYVLWRNNEESE